MSEKFDIAVIGSGPGGYVAALKAAQMGARTAVIEKHHLGGTCLNYGCIPSKALLASAELIHRINSAGQFGVNVESKAGFDWPAIQKRKDKVVKKLRSGVKGLLSAQKVSVFNGHGLISEPGKIQITSGGDSSHTIAADKTIIAVGSVPAHIPGWPEDPKLVCSSEEALHWEKLPKKLLIVGGGVIGCEFACMMHEYGVEVTVVEMLEGLLPEMEPALGQELEEIFKKRGMKIFTAAKVDSLKTDENKITAELSSGQKLEVDKVLTAVGRKPATDNIGRENIGLETERGFIPVDTGMKTKAKGYYCIGDANGRCLLAHAASAQGIEAVMDALSQDHAQDLPVPYAVYTFPEVASVGITTKQASKRDIPVRTGRFPIGFLGKAMAVGQQSGFVTVISHRQTDELLGVHMIGPNATEIIEAACAMMTVGAKAKHLGDMVFAHPTMGESVKEAAEDLYLSALHKPPRKMVRKTAELAS